MQKHLPFLISKTLAYALMGLGIVYITWVLAPIVKAESLFYYYRLVPRQPQISSFKDLTAVDTKPASFGKILNTPPPLNQSPVNTDFSLIIDKINVNVPVIANISVTNKEAYLIALEKGVTHAANTALPKITNTASNTYLFAHSTLNPLEIKKYSAVFTLLHRLEKGDRLVIFYQGNRYDYQVRKKEIVDGLDTTPLTRSFTKPTLTLQTCDPPGIPKNRLIITAELDHVYTKT